MYIFPFEKDDILHYVNEAHPYFKIWMTSDGLTASFSSNELVQTGEMYVGSPVSDGQFIVKNADNASDVPQGISADDYWTGSYGDQIQLNDGILSASLSTYKFWSTKDTTDYDRYLYALHAPLMGYEFRSPHYAYSCSLWDKETQNLMMISLPEAFYGSRLLKGTVKLEFWHSGSLVATAEDSKENGELIDLESGDVAGVVMYNEGVLLLTGSWSLDDSISDITSAWNPDGHPRWCFWGDEEAEPCKYSLEYKGVTQTPTMIMYVHAPKGALNHSLNPSYVDVEQVEDLLDFSSSSLGFVENDKVGLTNTVYSQYDEVYKSFRKQTYISKIAILDEKKNIIAIASLAEPVRKIESREYVYKLGLDT